MFREIAKKEPDTTKVAATAKTWQQLCRTAGERDRTLNTRARFTEILRIFEPAKAVPMAVPPALPGSGRRLSKDITRPEVSPGEHPRRFSIGGGRRLL
jgi:hypothetical protein